MSSDRSIGHQWGKERENMGPVHTSSSVFYRTQKTTSAPGHSCYGPTSPCRSPAFLLLAALRNGNHMVKGMGPSHFRFSIH